MYGSDLPGGVEPEFSVVDTGPTEAAGRAVAFVAAGSRGDFENLGWLGSNPPEHSQGQVVRWQQLGDRAGFMRAGELKVKN